VWAVLGVLVALPRREKSDGFDTKMQKKCVVILERCPKNRGREGVFLRRKLYEPKHNL
jgi:hypothetical protein